MKLSIIIIILTIISIAAGLYFFGKKAIYNEGLEETYGGWEKDADVPPDPNNPGFTVEWNVSRVLAPVKS